MSVTTDVAEQRADRTVKLRSINDDAKYQIVNDLGEDEFLRLKQNIGSEGLLQPIEVYFGAEGNKWIIDGHQRVEH